MRRDPDCYAPLGLDPLRELKGLLYGLIAAAVWSLGYLFSLNNHYDNLFWAGRGRTLYPDAVMTDFAEIVGPFLLGFAAVALCMVPLAAAHYGYHYQGGRSIYLMRRLPSRWELPRRCLAIPALGLAASLLAALVFTLIYFGIYMAVTPPQCLAPGQWHKLWQWLPGL